MVATRDKVDNSETSDVFSLSIVVNEILSDHAVEQRSHGGGHHELGDAQIASGGEDHEQLAFYRGEGAVCNCWQ